ncbi:hypothetical protein FG386_002899 [Cryptosporidium ryanae]|uniref:uncharacterized protein n=1 Tax=Cryptosporidium ryanae TaxID=515981 RepID=UPI00351A906F|nr:hypothetical protein FG386_002899 [Cryptosporidium ryanae]
MLNFKNIFLSVACLVFFTHLCLAIGINVDIRNEEILKNYQTSLLEHKIIKVEDTIKGISLVEPLLLVAIQESDDFHKVPFLSTTKTYSNKCDKISQFIFYSIANNSFYFATVRCPASMSFFLEKGILSVIFFGHETVYSPDLFSFKIKSMRRQMMPEYLKRFSSSFIHSNFISNNDQLGFHNLLTSLSEMSKPKFLGVLTSASDRLVVFTPDNNEYSNSPQNEHVFAVFEYSNGGVRFVFGLPIPQNCRYSYKKHASLMRYRCRKLRFSYDLTSATLKHHRMTILTENIMGLSIPTLSIEYRTEGDKLVPYSTKPFNEYNVKSTEYYHKQDLSNSLKPKFDMFSDYKKSLKNLFSGRIINIEGTYKTMKKYEPLLLVAFDTDKHYRIPFLYTTNMFFKSCSKLKAVTFYSIKYRRFVSMKIECSNKVSLFLNNGSLVTIFIDSNDVKECSIYEIKSDFVKIDPMTFSVLRRLFFAKNFSPKTDQIYPKDIESVEYVGMLSQGMTSIKENAKKMSGWVTNKDNLTYLIFSFASSNGNEGFLGVPFFPNCKCKMDLKKPKIVFECKQVLFSYDLKIGLIIYRGFGIRSTNIFGSHVHYSKLLNTGDSLVMAISASLGNVDHIGALEDLFILRHNIESDFFTETEEVVNNSDNEGVDQKKEDDKDGVEGVENVKKERKRKRRDSDKKHDSKTDGGEDEKGGDDGNKKKRQTERKSTSNKEDEDKKKGIDN